MKPLVSRNLANCFARTIGLCLLYVAPIALAQSDALLILTNPASQIAFVGTNVTFSVSCGGATAISYQWNNNGIAVSEATNSVFTLYSVTTNDSGSYSVTVSDGTNSETSAPAILTVIIPRMWVMGDNSSGQLGDGTLSDRPLPVSPLGGALLMAGGASHSLFVKPDGTLWAMGNNASGQLGDGTTVQRITPVPVWTNVIGLAAGVNHSLLIDSNNVLWAFGDNSYGQLGDGTGTQQNSPVSISQNVTFVAAGAYHSLFVTSDGNLWAMGNNNSGQLGDGTSTSRNAPVIVASNVISAAGGGYHSFFLQSDGTLYGMGANKSGQLGDGTTNSHSVPVIVGYNVSCMSAGAYHSLFVKSDGTLWAMGDNSYGQLGDGTTAQHNNPVIVASGVASVASGFFHGLFVGTNGALWAMGANSSGQLGDGTWAMQPLPVCVGSNVTRVAAGAIHSLFAAENLQPFTIVAQPQSQSAWVGDTVSLAAAVTEEPDLNYQWSWYAGGTNIPGINSPTLTLTDVQLDYSGVYQAIVTVEGLGSVISSEALLAVAPVGAPTVWADGQEVIEAITNMPSAVISIYDRYSDGYIFYTLDGTQPTFASAVYDGSFTVSNSVIVQALWLSFDFSTTAESPPATITVLPFTVNAATQGGGTVSLSPDQAYYESGAIVTLTALPFDGWTFLYWQGDVASTNNPASIVLDNNKNVEAVFGTTVVTNVVGNGSIQVVPPGPVPYGTPVQVMAVPAAGNFFVVWGGSIGGQTNPVSFLVTASTPLVSALFSVSVAGAPVITAAPASVSAGLGSNLILSVEATGGALTYQWFFNGIAMKGMTGSTLAITNLGPQNAGEYHVTVSGTGGIISSPPAYIALTDFGVRPVISISGVPGMPFRVDYTEDIGTNSWQVLTNSTLIDSNQNVIDFSAASAPRRFYRVVIDPGQ